MVLRAITDIFSGVELCVYIPTDTITCCKIQFIFSFLKETKVPYELLTGLVFCIFVSIEECRKKLRLA
jgi:hypothetical protein